MTGRATDGNSARNLLYGPSYRVVDLADILGIFVWAKDTRVSLRAEGTNVFNLVNLGMPGDSVSAAGSTSASFGVITSASAMRRLQFGARFIF